ncbi:MAG: hypothetical protein K6E62_06215 [Lachnospiraceae bacterium]|nr:hypothetical protein [Lachnospiraceae bacterium]
MKKINAHISLLLVICLLFGGMMQPQKVSASTEDPAVLSGPASDVLPGISSDALPELPDEILRPEGEKIDILSEDCSGTSDTSGTSGTSKTGNGQKDGSLRTVKNGGYSGYFLTELGGNEYAYNSLNDSQKRLFDAMGDRMEMFIHSDDYREDLDKNSAFVQTDYDLEPQDELTEEDIVRVIHTFIYANPQYYWVGLNYSYGLAGGNARTVLSVDPYYYKYSTRKAADEAIETVAAEWVDLVREAAAAGDYFGALKCHDLIIRSIDYAYNSSGKAEDSMWAHNIAGVFTGQGSVCEGYAKTFEYILDRAGIPNIYIIGKGAKEDHSWNAVCIDDKWYLCDITWDDPNHLSAEGLKDANYTYFCMPSSFFGENHRAWGLENDYGYELPEFEDTLDWVYFNVFECYSDSVFTEESGEAFALTAVDNRYRDNDFIYVVFPTGAQNSFYSYVAPYLPGFDPGAEYLMLDTLYGIVLKFEAPVIEIPAESIALDCESLELAIAESKTVKASLTQGSDDRVVWSVSMYAEKDAEGAEDQTAAGGDASRYVRLSARGTEVVVTGRRNGTVVLTASVYSSLTSQSPITASCVIKVGTGGSSGEAVIWQNGTKTTKSVTIKSSLSASTWKDSKGKIKSGKLVWFVADTPTDPVFDKTKHTVSFSVPKSKKASVNAKGVVTAKTAGTVYVYICDTGSLDYEEHVIDIAAGPTKLFLTSAPNTTSKDYVLKKVALNAGLSGKFYITPFIKDGAVDTECTYTAKVSKFAMEKYLSLDAVVKDNDGNPYVIVHALDFDRIKARTVSVKIDVICDQTGKKSSLTVVIGNSVENAFLEASSEDEITLAHKKDSITLNLKLETILGTTDVTTDRIKIYVGNTDVSFNENDRVEADRGATVKAKFDRKTMKLTLTASKDAGATALITAAFTDVLTKDTILIDLADVDEKGVVKLW